MYIARIVIQKGFYTSAFRFTYANIISQIHTQHTICAKMKRLLWSHHHDQDKSSEAAWVSIPFRLINGIAQIHQVRVKHLTHEKINGECDRGKETTQQRLLHLIERLRSLVLQKSINWMISIRIILRIYFKLPSQQGTLKYLRTSHMVK